MLPGASVNANDVYGSAGALLVEPGLVTDTGNAFEL